MQIARHKIKLPAASSRGINVDVIAPADSHLSSFVVHEGLDVRNGAGSSIYILRCKQRGIRPSPRNKRLLFFTLCGTIYEALTEY
jgi:hypothetical protein